jgi:hypothetical protein
MPCLRPSTATRRHRHALPLRDSCNPSSPLAASAASLLTCSHLVDAPMADALPAEMTCAKLTAGPHARNRQTLPARNYHISYVCTHIVTSHPSLHREIAAQPTGLPAKGRLWHPRRRQCTYCIRHAPHASSWTRSSADCMHVSDPLPTSDTGLGIPNALDHSMTPRLEPPHPSLPRRDTARPSIYTPLEGLKTM